LDRRPVGDQLLDLLLDRLLLPDGEAAAVA
jgi:hypothetical protein